MPFTAPRASFARPNDVTPYGIGDLVANSTTGANVERMRFGVEACDGKGRITAVNVFTDFENVTLATFNLHLWRVDPGAPANGDNGAFAVASARDYLGAIACDLAAGAVVTATDKGKRFTIAVPIHFQVPMTSEALFALISAAAAYVPAALEVFEVTLEIEF